MGPGPLRRRSEEHCAKDGTHLSPQLPSNGLGRNPVCPLLGETIAETSTYIPSEGRATGHKDRADGEGVLALSSAPRRVTSPSLLMVSGML